MTRATGSVCVHACTRIGIDTLARRFSFRRREKYVRTRSVAYIIHKDRAARTQLHPAAARSATRTRTCRELGSTVKTVNGLGYGAQRSFRENKSRGSETNARAGRAGGTELRQRTGKGGKVGTDVAGTTMRPRRCSDVPGDGKKKTIMAK